MYAQALTRKNRIPCYIFVIYLRPPSTFKPRVVFDRYSCAGDRGSTFHYLGLKKNSLRIYYSSFVCISNLVLINKYMAYCLLGSFFLGCFRHCMFIGLDGVQFGRD